MKNAAAADRPHLTAPKIGRKTRKGYLLARTATPTSAACATWETTLNVGIAMTDKITIERETLRQLHDEMETVEYDADPPKRVLALMDKLRAALAAQPAEAKQEPVTPTLPPWWFEFIVAVCELPDRNSPEGEPDAMVATEDELASCALAAIERTPPDECVAALKSRLQAIGDLAASCRTGPGLREAMKEIECIAAAQPAPAAVPLTDEQIALAIFEARVGHSPFKRDGSTSFRIARSAIAKFCEVNGILAAGDKP